MLTVAGLCSGCSPTFDWREVRAVEGLVALFPCRPQSFVRRVALDGKTVQMSLMSCAAGGSTFAVSRIELEEPGLRDRSLRALSAALVDNLSRGDDLPVPPVVTAGRLGGQHLVVAGTEPGGGPMHAHGEFFGRGTAVYQATVIGRDPDPDAVEFFFSALVTK